MSEVLSQQEIDQLLAELSSGEISTDDIGKEQEEAQVKLYNFRHPKKLARDQLRTLEMIYENYSRFVSTTLSAQLRTFVDMKVASVEPLSYEEFTRSLMVPTVLGIGEMEPLKGQFILEINPKIAYSIIDRLFGGDGISTVDNRTFTEIEGMALRQVMQWMFNDLPEAWQNVQPNLEPIVKELESNPLFAQIVHHNDMIILITFEVTVNEVEGFINFCLPFMMLEPVVGRLTAQHWFSSMQEKQSEFEGKIQSRLRKSFLDISVEFPSTAITVEELMGLQAGDVLKLDVTTEDDIYIRVGKKIKFLGQVGKKKDRLAARLTKTSPGQLKEEDDEE